MLWFSLGGVRFPSSSILLYNPQMVVLGYGVAQVPMSPKQFTEFDRIMKLRVLDKTLVEIPADEVVPKDEEVHTGSKVPGATASDTGTSADVHVTVEDSDVFSCADLPGGLVPPSPKDIAAEAELRYGTGTDVPSGLYTAEDAGQEQVPPTWL